MAEFSTIFPWIDNLLIFVGMLALCWRALSALHELAKLLAQQLSGRSVTVPAAVRPAALPVPPAKTPEPAKPSGPFADAPTWFQWALHEIGFHETGSNGGLDRYIALAHCGQNGDPWCAIFANASLEASGIPGTRSAASQSFKSHPNFVQLSGPALGAIVVFWRGQKDSGFGHVGFYRGEDASRVWTLGGNENDMVQIEALPKSSGSFGLIGYFWPKSIPLPSSAPVMMPAGSPNSVQAPPGDAPAGAPNGLQTSIVATMFTGDHSAYGGPIDDNSFGVALPLRFEGERQRVRVTNSAGKSIEADIIDVGPWNTHDPYWLTGARPQAETGTDTRGRHTNKAGIDLTFAAAKALGIDGKGIVSWEFIATPETPKAT